MNHSYKMKIKLLIAALVLVIILVGNTNYYATGQSTQAGYHLAFMTVPQKLIHNTDASLLVYAVDDLGAPLPIRFSSLSVTSSDPSVVSIKNVSFSEFDNSVRVDIHAGKIGSATITAATYGFLSSEVKLDVVGDAYKPEGLLVKAVPSKFSHFGPYKGYVSVQLVNFFGKPLPADEDTTIKLSSSNSDVVDLNSEVVIKRGEYFAYKEFTALNPGITLLEAEVLGKWKESVKVTVEQPLGPLKLTLNAFPDIVPAMQGARVYAFVQLQDANGIPVKADKDISVNIISDSNNIKPGTGIIKKGETHTQIMLRVNTNTPCKSPPYVEFKPCVELTAVGKGYTTSPVKVELREAVNQDKLNPDTRIFDPTTKVDPVLYSVPLLADGKDQVIGLVQLQTVNTEGAVVKEQTQPVVASIDLSPAIVSSDLDILQIKETKIERSASLALIEAKMGYKTGSPDLVIAAEFFGESVTKLTVHGHTGLTLAAEPLIDKIIARSEFPMAVYLKDSTGSPSFSLGDMQLSISKVDTPEAEIGTSMTTTDILTIQSAMMNKGSSIKLLKAASTGKGSSTITFEGSIKDFIFSTQNTITMSTTVPEKLGIFIPTLILGNSKYTIPLQVLDKDGFPIKTTSDVEVLLVPSVRNVVSTPASVIIPRNQYYTTLLIEASGGGQTEVTAQANNFQSTKLNVQVTTAKPTVVLTPSVNVVRVGDTFTVTLSSEYLGTPIRDLQIEWSSDEARIISADERTDENGRAEATFLIDHATPFVVRAEVSGYGYENSVITQELIADTSVAETGTDVSGFDGSLKEGIFDILTNNFYFLILPAIGGIVFWLIKTERISLPFGSLFERFRKSED